MKQYCIIGAIANKYTPDNIKPFVESIITSGFVGGKYMIVYDVPTETITYLKESGFEVVEKNSLPDDLKTKHIWGENGVYWGHSVMVYRFKDWAELISSQSFNYSDVIVADVKDTIFQSDPSVWLEKNQTHSIVVGSESILVKDMDWSSRCYKESYPKQYHTVEDKLSYCCGVVSGESTAMSNFCNEIYNLSMETSAMKHPPDQAAMNILLARKEFADMTQIVTHEDGYVTHLGVSLSDPEQYTKNLQDIPPIIKDGKIYNHNGELFPIIHQYDRLKNFIYKL